MIEESIICAPMDREHLAFAYTIYWFWRQPDVIIERYTDFQMYEDG
jgi:hypothetical protein